MRDAFGGTFMIKLALIFIIVYISFMAIALNYAKAFRVKNGVINIVEQNRYDGTADDPAISLINTYLAEAKYNYGSSSAVSDYCYDRVADTGDDSEVFTESGACIVPKGSVDSRYYEVVTFVHVKMPFFGLNLTIPIRGETKIIY